MRTKVSSSENLPGRATMAVGRALDPFVQYSLLRNGYAGSALESIGIRPMITDPLVSRVGLGLKGLGTVFDWGYVDKPGNLLVFATGIASLRHLYWSLFQANENFSPSAGAGVAAFNTVINTLNTLILVYRISRVKTNPLKSGWMQYVGLALVIAGNLGEVVAERGREAFKRDVRNKGKIYAGGAFGVVRHPNYAFYTIWRTGLALATGSVLNTFLQFGGFVAFFAFGSIQELGGHMQKRYGGAWESYKRQVPYALIPYVL